MSLIQAFVLGVVQGITEFLPISSDGHLALVYHWFGAKPNLTFEVFLHAATLVALVAYFWRDLIELASSLLPANKHRTEDRWTVLWVAVGTVVSAVIALALSDVVEPASESLIAIGIGFLVTALFLSLGEGLSGRVKHLPDMSHLGWVRAAFIGLLQGTAVLPGVSRSGSTIAAGVLSGMKREKAARYSFLLGFPIITLAALKDFFDIIGGSESLPGLGPSVVGFAAALVSGYAAVWWLLPFLKKHKLWGFAAYTAVLGAVILILGITGRG